MQRLIVTMAQANPTWGEERIANELRLKLGVRVSPRTVGCRTLRPRRDRPRSQRWGTFVRNHAHAVLACDFFTTVAVRFRILCERLIGTMRRECLDWLIPMHEGHLRWILREWVTHYNRGRPHASLRPGIPDPLPELNELVSDGCRVPEHVRVVATPVLGGLHHEYRLARDAA